MPIRRAKGTGSVQKKGSKYYFRVKINGKEIVRRMPEVSNDKEADLEATRLYTIASAKTKEEIALFSGRARELIKEANSVSFREAFEKFKASSIRPSCTEDTLKQHKRFWKYFMDWLGLNVPYVKTLSEVDESVAVNFFNYVSIQKQPRTFNAILNTVRLVYKTLEKDNNPFLLIRKRSEDTNTRNEFDIDQLEKIFQIIDNKGIHLMHRDEIRILFFLGAFTGLRFKDCCLMKWRNIDLTTGIIRVIPEKTKKNKNFVNVPIHNRLMEQLKAALEWKINEFVLPECAKRYSYNQSGLYKDTKRVIDYSMWAEPQKDRRPPSMPGYTFHSLRHTFVSICANAGVPLSVVQEIVGHGNPAMTKYYTHVGTESLRKAVNTLPGSKAHTASADEKLAEIKEILSSKKVHDDYDKQILSLLE
ncbi:MAG: site-specific integrase [Victivallales bacterium]|nr:site-specific integrase [Victivallales bacterium]